MTTDDDAQATLTVTLHDDYVRDGYKAALYTLIGASAAAVLLLILSLYLVFARSAPVTFMTDEAWRVVAPVSIDKPYLSEPDLLQWVSDVLPEVFTVDFVNYQQEVNASMRYFNTEGWKKFTAQLNNYASSSMMTQGKFFVRSSAAGSPFIVNQGLLQGAYAWRIQMPLVLSYSSADKASNLSLMVEILVVRVPTLDDLKGIRIADMVVSNNAEGQNG